MNNKRADLRKYYQSEAEIAKNDKLFADRSVQLLSMEETIANAFKALLDLIDGKTTKTEIINQLESIKTPDVENVVKSLELLSKDVLSTKIDTKPLLDALNGLKREITLIPAKIPTPEAQKDTIKVSNLSEVKLDTSNLQKAIEALDLKVDVKAPIINTEKTDIEPLRKVMLDMLKAINKQEPIESVKVSNLKDIPVADLSKVEKKLDESNKHLKKLVDKPTGGGGGGGNGSPYTDNNGIVKNVVLTTDGRIPVDIDMATDNISTSANQTNGSQKTQIVDANNKTHVFENY